MSTPRKDPPEKDRDEKPKEAKKPKDDKEKDEKPPKEHKGKAHKSKKDKGKAEKPKDDEGRGEKPIEVQERAEKPIEVKEGAEKPKKKDEKPKEDEKPTGVKEQTEKPQDDRDRDEKPKHDKEKMEKPKGDKPKVSKEKAGKSKDSKEHVEKPKDHKEKGEKSKDDKDKGARPKDDKDKGARPKDDKDKGARPKDDKDKGARPKDDKEQGDKGKKKGRRESLKSHMARKKKEMQDNPEPGPSGCNLVDPYANSTASNYITRGRTGIVYDTEVLKHKCEWDDKYPENPQRLSAIMEKCYEKGLLARCHQIKNYLRADLYEKILLVHSKEHYDKLKSLSQCANLAMMECEASEYDSVYFNRFTFDATCRALSSVLNLVDAVAKRDVQNGMAFVRPPGHHAMHHEYNGYCFFNNVAVAAESCIKDGHASRILIVDIDVHHGQGTQRQFYDRKDVLYFSIHRYQHGTFWPNLLESNFNYIGKGEGLGYNINVPLNSTGLTDDDYLAIVFSILLPVGYEFNPNLVIVSAGYDAALGCPEGKMNVTPGFYAHLISHLSTLARGQIAVVLEGGYFLPTLSEGASLTLKALLGGPCPILDPIKNVHPSVVETICNVRRSLYNKWNCFKICELIPPTEVPTDSDEHQYQISYFGEVDKAPYPTRRCYPENSIPEHNFYTRLNKALKEKYRGSIDLPVYYVYDDQMLQHCPQRGDIERPERPERLTSIMNLFHEFGVDQRLMRTPIIRRDFTSWSPHSRHYFSTVNIAMKQTKDVYVNEYTHDSVLLAVCGLLNLIDAIMNGEARAGVAVVRPPGHHAEHNKPLGFCFINNIAVAANYVHLKYNIQRILIVDFDIHHGNGTQNMFYQSSNVMYISIHKDEEGKFFPANSPRTCKHDGYACGKGFNINIPFNKDKMGDTEYLAAFHNIILPAAYAFAPQIVLVSAGFDAGIHDPLGGYSVNPETFGHFIQMLKPLAEGRLILSLEGGYNLTTTSYAMTICTKVLLGDPVMMPKNVFKTFSDEAVKTIREVTNHFKKYYNIFHINKPLGTTPSLVKKVRRFTQESYAMELVKVLDVDRVDDNEYVENEMRSLNDSRQSLV